MEMHKILLHLKKKQDRCLPCTEVLSPSCPYVEDNESSKKEVSSDDWITVLEQMHQCVEQFDMDGVDHTMETMETFQTPDKLKDLMEQLRVCVADVEMEEIMKLTDTMVNLLQ